MSTTAFPTSVPVAQVSREGLSIREAVDILSREERFMGTVAAMNTLLIHKGIYTQQEFDTVFCRWAKTQLERSKSQRPGWRSSIRSLFSRSR